VVVFVLTTKSNEEKIKNQLPQQMGTKIVLDAKYNEKQKPNCCRITYPFFHLLLNYQSPPSAWNRTKKDTKENFTLTVFS